MTKEIENMEKMFVTFGGEVEQGDVDDLLNRIEKTYTEDENLLKKNLGNEETVRLIYGIKGFPTYLHEILNSSDKPEKVTKLNGPKDLVDWLHKEFRLNTIVSKIYAQVILGILTTMNMSADDLEDMKGGITHPSEEAIDKDGEDDKDSNIINADFIEDEPEKMDEELNIDELIDEEEIENKGKVNKVIQTEKQQPKPIKPVNKDKKKDDAESNIDEKGTDVDESELDISCVSGIKVKYSSKMTVAIVDKIIATKYIKMSRFRDNELDNILYTITNLKDITSAIQSSKKLDDISKLTLITSIEGCIKKYTNLTTEDVMKLIDTHKTSLKQSESKIDMVKTVKGFLKMA